MPCKKKFIKAVRESKKAEEEKKQQNDRFGEEEVQLFFFGSHFFRLQQCCCSGAESNAVRMFCRAAEQVDLYRTEASETNYENV